jgi:integrase/recombinase XerC
MAKALISKEILKKWLDYMTSYKNYSNNTIISYKMDLDDFLRYLDEKKISPKSIADLSVSVVREWMLDAAENHGRSPRANSRALSSLKNLMRYLFAFENLDINQEILSMRHPKFTMNLPKPISEEEFEFSNLMKLGAECADDKKWIELCDKAIIILMYGAGLRISEALSVNFKNGIDSENMIISVFGKGGKSRVVPMMPLIINALEDYISSCPWINSNNYRDLDQIFFTPMGKIMTRNYFSNRMRYYAGKYRLPYKTSPHTFRHTFATHLIENGVSISEVQKLLGHAKLSTTELYIQVSNNAVTDMHNRYFGVES